ncbi:MAG TPA: carboxylating nicotinate-nucleotide diphosphorylase [Patescibacteria group bacterium]|nr:carboxylating nicotinate-nucleotide diphosphorylase [Patescibacteria group bacterium]
MNTQTIITTYFQKKEQLTIENQFYQHLVSDLFSWLMKNDQVQNDLTTKTLFDEDKHVSARIITRQNIIVAGIEEILFLLGKHTSLDIKQEARDTDHLQAGNTLLTLSGSLYELLAYERILLNMLQRMCGIATETASVLSKIDGDKPQIAATRKTHWGLLDKKAVAVGGGLTHRLNLSDGILVKDNHIFSLSPKAVLQKLLSSVENMLIEIEVENEDHLKELVDTFSNHQTTNALAILLDNFSPQEAKKIINKRETSDGIVYEASGGITKENITEWVKAGVDIISLGSLTHSPKAANLSLDLVI